MADAPTNSLTNQEVVTQGTAELRRTVQHLPAFYRTDANERFLASTMDALMQKGSLERLDAFIGKQDAYTRKASDKYLSATSRDRLAYQLEPAVTYSLNDTTSINPEDQVEFTGTYDDYINQIKYFGGKTNNHDRLNKAKVYSWNPAIDYDKLINYREYYWLPEGPSALEIDSVGPGATIEIKVTNVVKGAYNFSVQDGTNNPILKLYRGNTYKFNVDAKGHPFWIMTEPYKDKISADGSTSTIYDTGVTNNGTDYGTVTFTVPTTGPNFLFYQCGVHDAMNGSLEIATVQSTDKIKPDKEIIGATNYSLRTLDLSNGMKIKFANAKVDTEYQNKEYYVEGVGDKITLTDVSKLINPGSYAEEFTVGYDSFLFDQQPYAKALHRPETLDYITIKRDSIDRNAWSRYNRWFHRSIIEEVARIEGYTANLNETDRAKRPIIEFDSGLALYNHGTVAKDPLKVIDTVTTDAFSTVVNQTGYTVDGIELEEGDRVIFTADTDNLVKNNIYVVNFITASDSSKVIALTKATDGTPADGDSVFVEFGTKNIGKTFYYDSSSTSWKEAQHKSQVNQQPLFGMWDNNHVSFDDATTYPNSSFAGAKVFEYATSDSATEDTVLGIKVKYQTINNVGDIVFDSDHTNGTFTYKSDKKTVTKSLAEGHLHYTTSLTSHNSRSAWIERLAESKQRVIRTFEATSVEKRLFPIDFYANSIDISDLDISVKVNGVNKSIDTDFTIVDGTVNKFVRFVDELEVGDQIRLSGYSAEDKVDTKGIYEIASNLEINAENTQLGTFTLGQISKHVQDIQDKNSDVTGVVPGVSNLRDKPEARLKGGKILQHQGSLLPAVFGLIDQKANVIRSIEYTSKKYEQWYSSFLTKALGTAYEGVVRDRVDEIISAISEGQNSGSPFYYEDMAGYGENVSTRTYTVRDDLETEYAIDKQHSLTELSNRAVYVYLNDVQLLEGNDYTFSATDDSINISATLTDGDKIIIKDYADTTGSFIPPTPTKLGMYPKFKPELFSDDTYLTTTDVIRRHDGSIIKAYGDERDDLILELEKRIYNNCKTAYDASILDINDVKPSAFTSTEFTRSEIDDIMATDFYVWAGRNNVQYINNTVFTEGSPFTYNYSNSTDRLNNEKLPGYWRGIYQYFYDTDAPHLRPWEILGHSEKPSDWDSTYGAAPYTAGNDVLWSAIANESGRYGKPDIKNYLPVDTSGNLLDPIAAGLVEDYDVPGRRSSWKFGDQAPAETAWRRSSAYPYTVVKTLALTKPAKFFSVFFDNSRLTLNTANNYIDKDTGVRQNLAKAKYHLETETDNTTGTVTRYATAGYQPLVVGYLTSQNLDPKTFFYDKCKGLKTQLAYKLGGFSDKDNLKVLTDSVSPGSTSGSKFIPDENYKILFRTSNPVETFDYSGVLIEKNTDVSSDGSTLLGGYKILGYSTTKPFFKFNYPIKTLTAKKVSVIDAEVAVYDNYQQDVQTIPYGYVFETRQDVADFLLGHGYYLEQQGFRFNKYSKEIKETLNWRNAVSEFLYWTEQNWAPGSAVTVSPAADGFELDTNNTIVGRLKNIAGDYSMLDAGGRKLDIREVSTKRIGKTFDLNIKSPDVGLYNISLNTVQKEHLLLFDNKTVFSDVIYDPYTGFRQERLKLVGWKTSNWNGDYYAPGFVFDSAEVKYWSRNKDYKIGDTVEYSGKFYVAKSNHTSTDQFEASNWTLKDEKPQPQLIPNFDYKIQQFNDFYNLETNNFDESQQELAQRLIGYQSRDYLENLFVNDVSQYKFYQGYIREKGTQNAIDKLLKAKYEDQDITLNMYPEWMIRTGRFGNVDARENIQITLNENEILANPQSLEFYGTTNFTKDYARSLGISKTDFYHDPVDYDTATTFSKYNYDTQGVSRDSVQKLKTAGYVQPAQVQLTAFNEIDLVNLDVSTITRNDLVWVANKSNKDWDVLRLSSAGVQIVTVQKINDNLEIIITFNDSHGLSAQTNRTEASFFAIINAQIPDLNGVYKVKTVVNHKSVIIDFDGDLAGVPTLADESTADLYGSLYKFISVRMDSMDNVNDNIAYNVWRNRNDALDTPGDKVFTDADSTGLWRVYEKQNAYSVFRQLSPDTTTTQQDFGTQIVARNDGRTAVVSAPKKGQGEIHFLFRRTASAGTEFQTQSTVTTTAGNDNTGRLGYSLTMSTDENFVVAGAPFANSIGSDGSTRFADAGLIEIFVWDPTRFTYSALNTLLPPTDEASQNFGWAHKICEPTIDSIRSTPVKYLFVSAPGISTDTGAVYMYEWGVGSDGSTYDTWTQNLTISSNDPASNKRFGHALAANDNGDILAVSSKAPGKAGMVEIFTRTSQSNDDSVDHSFTLVQTLSAVSSDGSSVNTQFGDSIAMSKDGTTLMITAPGLDVGNQADAGAVYYYKWDADGDSTLAYTLQQTINAPDGQINNKFGSSIDINDDATRLVIGAENNGNSRQMLFDLDATTFDLQDTRFVDSNTGSGGAYTATKYNTKFIIDERLVTTSVSANDDFGRGVCVIDNTVFVGAPDDEGNVGSDGSSLVADDGTVTIFDANKSGEYAWKNITTETPLMDVSKLGQTFDFNVNTKQIRDFYELYNPVQGRIPGIADREIQYKTTWDPAVYNFGANANRQTPWAEKHIGEVWWDLSKVKWLWYEQDTQEYKTNHWGQTFPGSQIHVYQWVESTVPPSRYQQLGTGGIPLHADDSNLTIKDRYNGRLDRTIRYYYYWVRDDNAIPLNSVVGRKNTVAFVKNLIENPQRQGHKWFAPTDTNKMLLANVRGLSNDTIKLNIDIRTNNSDASAHSVWKLVKEGDPAQRPSTQVEQRWWDSLVGKNIEGDMVPDINLPLNERYGNEIRPRQSWYVNRYNALKEIIDYSNTVLKKIQLTGPIKLDNLNKADPEPTAASLEWDAVVDTHVELSYINTADLSGAVKYLVKADETANNFWSIYTWDGTQFNRTKLQGFNTGAYWSYVDWYGTDPEVHEMIHDENTPIDAQVTYEYELDSLDLAVGKHVKVTQGDTGGWKLFMKTAKGYTNVGTENGTIRLSTKLYDYTQDATGFAGEDNFDDNFFDQEPTKETRNILTALRDDLFINELAVEYNNLFFIGLRKVLQEQTYVDWLFKTSFINVTNTVRKLDQRKSYTAGTDSWVESYINEVKPFHSKIREYKLGYESTDTQDGIFSDFDNPPFYDSAESKIRNLNVTSDSDKLTEYPHQIWYDNHKKYVTSITVSYSGTGYETAPTVTVLGGTTASTGPFQIQGNSNRGATSGTYGYYYPLFTSERLAKTWDTQNNGGSGTATEFSFDEYEGTFWMPDATTNTGQSSRSTVYKMYETPDTTAATATATVVDGRVTKITLVSNGKNYTTTPTVVLTGGKNDGTTPSDTARAYANLQNDLVRDIDTTIKFDRVHPVHAVVDWAINTSYAYGQLIRYNNELYKATDHFTSNTKFNDNIGKVYKIRGDETGLTAADRTAGFYTPGSGMPGNELSQLMAGVDYGGTMVTGLLFRQGQGWDNADWYDYPWDNFGDTRVKAFIADGSTNTYTFTTAPAKSDVYSVYTTLGDSTRTKLSDVFRGDGSTTSFQLSTTPDENALVEFIPIDDDGVLTPTDDRTLDTLLKGGLFNTALGTAASDILTDGDQFVSPETSYAPEEAVPGQMFDTVDIKVYTSPESGVPFITENLYTGDAVTTTFALGDFPGSLASVTVSVDGTVKRLTTDYTVDVGDKTITFGSAPGLGKAISVRTFAVSGENYRVLDQYRGDGSTTTFTTSTRGEFNLDSTASDIYVTIDGGPTTLFSTTTTANTITVTFDSAPAANAFVQIAGFNKSTTSTRSFASIRNELITFNSAITRYTLSFPPGAIGPLSGLTMIEVGGKMLRGPDISYYVGDGTTTRYGFNPLTGLGEDSTFTNTLGEDSTIDPVKTITDPSQIVVHVNGVKQVQNTDYVVDLAGTILTADETDTVDTTLVTTDVAGSPDRISFVTAPAQNDLIAISTLVDNHYTVDGTDVILEPAQISSDGYSLSSGDVINVTTFNNALGMKLRREVLEGKTNNVFKLRFDTLNPSYTFAWFNGEQLTPGTGFTVSGNTLTVLNKTSITSSDRLDVMYFAVESAIGATGFRIFKDMLNRTFYKRINKNATTKIAQDVTDESIVIQVEDGTVLPEPNAANNIPGVIFVDKERIEYFTKSGDTLGQLRRGTLGTGIKDHSSGTAVVDASGTQTIPYTDTVYTNTFTGDGSTATFNLSQTPASASELDIFIGGQRLLLTSEDGSTINYSVDGSTAAVTLSTAPAADTQVKILHKRGQVWYTAADGNPADGKGLQASSTVQARFIADEPTNAPE